MAISDAFYNKSKTTLSIFYKQKKVFDKLLMKDGIRNGRKLNTHQFFGVLMEYYQAHIHCIDNDEAQKVLKHMKEIPTDDS